MRVTNLTSVRNIGFSLVTVLAMLPLLYAERPQQSDRGDRGDRGAGPSRDEPAPHGGPGPRGEPSHLSEEHHPVIVDRSNHGSLRHMDTHVVEHPFPGNRNLDVHQHVVIHRDVEVDVHRPRFWHGFVFGARLHTLRPGCVRIFVNNTPYFFDNGIYFQQAGDDYQEVYPPVGATIPGLPDGAIEIEAGNLTYYYVGGAFYVQQNGGFVIAPTPMGVTVPELPPGAVQVSINNTIAYQFNGIYYQPVFADGVTQYMTFMP